VKEYKVYHRHAYLLLGDPDLKAPEDCQERWPLTTFS